MAEVYRRERAELNSPLRQGSWYRTDNGAAMRRTEALEQIREEFKPRFEERPDPTRLIVVDEADRLKMAGLEQLRAIFDQGGHRTCVHRPSATTSRSVFVPPHPDQ